MLKYLLELCLIYHLHIFFIHTYKCILTHGSLIFIFRISNEMALKILVAGDADGNMAALFKKIETVNKKVCWQRLSLHMFSSVHELYESYIFGT